MKILGYQIHGTDDKFVYKYNVEAKSLQDALDKLYKKSPPKKFFAKLVFLFHHNENADPKKTVFPSKVWARKRNEKEFKEIKTVGLTKRLPNFDALLNDILLNR